MRNVLLVSFLILASIAKAQTFKQWTEQGDLASEEGNYEAAAHYYGEAFQLDSTNFDITTKYAEALRLARDYQRAKYYYDKAFTKDRGRLFKPGQYYLALMQKQTGDYKSALRNFKKFYSKTKRKPLEETPLAEKEIESCTWALNTRKIEDKAEVIRLPGTINTEDSEMAPAFLDSTLYYSSLKSDGFVGGNIAIYASSLQDSLYQWIPEYETIANVPQSSCGNLSFSPDGTRAYWSVCKEVCAIYEGDFENGEVNRPRKIAVLNIDGCTATMPSVGIYQGQEYLFYASNRKGTRGGMDIWWSERAEDGSWKPPVNAGDNVNTAGDEITPSFIDKQLYFSSDFHIGYGGFDIQMSKGYPRSFDLPENVGYPLNGPYNDLYYRYEPKMNLGYFASNRPEGKPGDEKEAIACCNDIFSIGFRDSIPDEAERRYENLATLNDYLPVTLYFHNDEPNPNTRDTVSTKTYRESYAEYKKLLSRYISENEKGKKGEEKENARFDIESFFDLTVDKGVSDLKNFEGLLLEELEKGTSVELIIKGFASPRAKSDYNVNLTKRRISSLVKELGLADDGAFLPYIEQRASNGAKLVFTEVPFGEYKADQDVSDELDDEQLSIYSVEASLERKIEIQSVQRYVEDTLGILTWEEQVHDFGSIGALDRVNHTFLYSNTGVDTLYIDSILSPCGCTQPVPSMTTLAPEENGQLEVVFEPLGQVGVLSKTILIYHSESTEPQEITITVEVE